MFDNPVLETAADYVDNFKFNHNSVEYGKLADAAGYTTPFDIPNSMGIEFLAKHHTGSSYICDPPVTDTDIDVIVLVQSMEKEVAMLQSMGWMLKSDKSRKYKKAYPDSRFTPLWLGQFNLLVTDCAEHYHDFVTATKICKAMNVKDKQHRITIFEAIVKKKFLENL